MNNSKLMIAVAAAALIAGQSGVLAQQQGDASGQVAPKSSGGNKATNGATEERRIEQNRVLEERRDNDRIRATGQGATSNRENISSEKRAQLHQVFVKDRSAPRVDHVDFSLSVGTPVPRSVRFVPVPGTIVEIEPGWHGYDYFMVGEQIVIVDPRSMEIVAIIDA